MVSVIIPNYNHAPYLKKRIDSILNQSYQHFELIILDDCSTDESISVIESYRDNVKISHIVYNGQNSGSTFKQWEKGLKLAKGEYIWIAESDDWAEPFMLEKLIAAFDDHTSLCFCKSIRTWTEDLDANINYVFSFKKFQGFCFIKERMLYYNSIENASMAVFRKKYVNLFWFDEIAEMNYCGDWLFWIKLSENGDVVEFDEPFNYFRQHPGKVTSRAQRLGLDFIEGISVLNYIESVLKIRIPYNVLKYWSQTWTNLRWQFDKGITCKTFFKLVAFRFAFFYLIPFSLLKKKIKK